MAIITGATGRTEVHVLVLVTIETRAPAHRFRFRPSRVARLAVNVCMLAQQREAGLGPVIEAGVAPRHRNVTSFTLAAESLVVVIVVLMAGDTRKRCCVESSILMTGHTFDVPVSTGEGEPRRRMQER